MNETPYRPRGSILFLDRKRTLIEVESPISVVIRKSQEAITRAVARVLEPWLKIEFDWSEQE